MIRVDMCPKLYSFNSVAIKNPSRKVEQTHTHTHTCRNCSLAQQIISSHCTDTWWPQVCQQFTRSVSVTGWWGRGVVFGVGCGRCWGRTDRHQSKAKLCATSTQFRVCDSVLAFAAKQGNSSSVAIIRYRCYVGVCACVLCVCACV